MAKQLWGHRRGRVILAAVIAGAAMTATPAAWAPSSRALIGWIAGTLAYLVQAIWLMAHATPDSMRRRAAEVDDGLTIDFVLIVAAALTSVGAVAVELAGIRDQAGASLAVRLGLAGATILLGWLLLHTVFTTLYAHLYYAASAGARPLTFPGETAPDYWDFAYFAFTIGAAAQTSDVTITDRHVRRIALFHTVLSFLFNTTILALMINVGAGVL